MAQQKNLWDWAAQGATKGETQERTLQKVEMDASRRATLQKLRSNDSQWATLLRVARAFPGTFTLNDLSVACWHADPEAFGMKGHPHFPDNHRVHYIIYGERGLIAKGLIERVATGIFRMRQVAEENATEVT